MQVSDKEIQKILSGLSAKAQAELTSSVVEDINSLMDGIDEPKFESSEEFVSKLTKAVLEMPDREDRINELKARIDAGEYNPTSAEIVDAMIRRSIADKVQ